MQNSSEKKMRGRSAIDAAHAGITGADESRLDTTISSLYGVESDEANEIHANYHIDRMLASLEKRARENGMKRETLVERAQYLDIMGTAREVAKGKLLETAAVDVLFRSLSTMENRSDPSGQDRYINFYG